MNGPLKFLLRLVLSLSALALLSCASNSSNTDRARVLFPEEEGDYRGEKDKDSSRYSSSCRTEEDSSQLSLRDVDFIDSNNAGAYILRGRCEEDNKSVHITVNGYSISHNPNCDRRRWEVELDLSSVVTTEKNIVFQVSHNNSTVCREVRVAFTGPVGYIPVPPLKGYYESSFFVMKYEAKTENRSLSAKAVSKPDGLPLTQVTHEEAVKLCRNNGSRYDLIKNTQWQNIALSIEDTDENWSEGKNYISDNNALNCGISRGTAQPAKSKDQDDCADYDCAPSWDVKRRTHILANGEIIWDICGNVGEMMKDKYTEGIRFREDVYKLSGQLKKLFGPKRSYQLVSAGRRTNKWNLGYAEIENDHNLIVRGMPGRYSTGIFSTLINRDQESRRGYDPLIGFRCVYLP